jgi:hypothetical protein
MGGECGKYGGEEIGVQDLMEKSEGKKTTCTTAV